MSTRLARPPAQRLRELRTWARILACCPHCQVAPGTPCHVDGQPLEGGAVHARRYDEADRSVA